MPNPSIRSIVARLIATAGGAGYSPFAPGTCGTAVAVPLVWALSSVPLVGFVAITVVVTVVGIWAASVSDAFWGTHDSGRIVIDEVAGYMVTVLFVARDDWAFLLLGFILFRLFDIVKPPPVRWLDKNLPGGTGVVIDDIGAGIYGCAAMYGLSLTSIPTWMHSLS